MEGDGKEMDKTIQEKARKEVTMTDEFACYEKSFLKGKNCLILRTFQGLKIHLRSNVRGRI